MSTILKPTVTSPVQTPEEPISVLDIRISLEIADADNTRDSLFALYASMARKVAEYAQQRDLVTRQWDYFQSYFPCGHISLRDNATSIDTFRYRKSDGDYVAMVEGVDYEFDRALSVLTPVSNGMWPTADLWPSSAVEIQYTVTPPAISPSLKMGMLSLIGLWNANRVAEELGASDVQRYSYMLSLLDFGRREMV